VQICVLCCVTVGTPAMCIANQQTAAKFFLSHNLQEDKVPSYANVYITMRDFVFQNLSMNCYSVCDVTQVIVT